MKSKADLKNWRSNIFGLPNYWRCDLLFDDSRPFEFDRMVENAHPDRNVFLDNRLAETSIDVPKTVFAVVFCV
jgi:hypothetical protein